MLTYLIEVTGYYKLMEEQKKQAPRWPLAFLLAVLTPLIGLVPLVAAAGNWPWLTLASPPIVAVWGGIICGIVARRARETVTPLLWWAAAYCAYLIPTLLWLQYPVLHGVEFSKSGTSHLDFGVPFWDPMLETARALALNGAALAVLGPPLAYLIGRVFKRS